MPFAVGDRCVVALMPTTGELQSVQALPRLTGKISSRPSTAVGQIEPDEHSKAIAGANCFLRLSQVAGAIQLPAVGERVEFQLAPNPERADRLWAADVVPLESDSLAMQPVGRSTSAPVVDAPTPVDMATHAADAGTCVGAGLQQKRTFEPGCRVYIGCLPPETQLRDLQEIFAPYGEIVHIQLPLDEFGRRRGFGIVELERADIAAAAVQK